MPSTAKDSLFEATTAEGTVNSELQAARSSDAVGTEVSVTIHASRYSAAGKGAAKLPPVHEETRTVIIFPQGAVVRLSATVTPGELVVLTNNRTGADVICRVTSVKTQPGIQNYVNLEFTQRALGFWEEARQGEHSTVKDKPALGVVPPATPAPAPTQTPTPISAAPKVSISPAQVEPSARNSASSAEVKSISSQALKVTSLADSPAQQPREEVAEIPDVATQSPKIVPGSAISGKGPRAITPRAPRLGSFDAPTPDENAQQNNGSNKKIALVATAAIALLAIGAVGGALFLRWDRALANTPRASAAPVSTTRSEPVATVLTPGPATAEEAPIANASVRSASLPPAVSVSTVTGNVGSGTSAVPPPVPARLSIETPRLEVRSEAQPQPTNRPTIAVGKISAPNMKTSTKINAAEPPPVLTPDAAGISEGVVNSVRMNAPMAPAQPPAAASPNGGQLVQPKLISSIASVYPAGAKTAHVQGDVLVDALIDATGKVTATKVISGSALLQQAAVDSLRFWKYEPARLNGQPIPIHIKVNINFRLQ